MMTLDWMAVGVLLGYLLAIYVATVWHMSWRECWITAGAVVVVMVSASPFVWAVLQLSGAGPR